MRLLIVHPGGIGDVLLALPALRTLRMRHGAIEVGLLAGRQVGQLLRNCREVDRSFCLESGSLADLFSGVASHASPFVTWLRGCERVQCWMADRHGELAAALTAQGVRHIVIRSAMTGSWNGRHQSDRYLETAECLPPEEEAEQPLRLAGHMRMSGRKTLDEAGVPHHRPYAVIHPGSGSLHKCCHPAALASVLDWVTTKEFIPLVLEGPADQQQVSRLRAQWPQRLHILKDCELSALAWIMENAVLYVGHDSGITHLAAALAVPTVACFGPTDEARWGPRGRSVAIVRGAPCHCVTWEVVQQCRDKSCLMISSASLVHACETIVKRSQQMP